jgi:acetoin utilization protein AcuB
MFSIQPFISKLIFPLKPSDKGEFALELMDDWNITTLPVVEEKKYLGIVSRADLIDTKKVIEAVRQDPSFLVPQEIFLWNLLELFQESRNQIKIIVDEEGNYKGSITPQNILRALNQSFTISSEGLYIRIDISDRDYSLAQISHLAESENVKIMGLWIFGEDKDELTLLIKTNTTQVAGFISTLQRMHFNATAQKNVYDSGTSDENRFGLLMKYLDL